MDKPYIKSEIDSHSSALTNKRIDALMGIVDSAELDANQVLVPTIQHAIAYHSSILTLWFETLSIYNVDVNLAKEIENHVNMGEQVARFLKQNQLKARQKDVEWLIQNCKQLRFLMHVGLQKMKYLFRTIHVEPKGIKESMRLFRQGGWEGNEDIKKEEDENEVP